MPTAGRLLVLALTLLAWPAAASAASTVPPLPPRMPALVEQDCPGLPGAGCADTANMTAYITSSPDRFATAHELGHFADAQTFDPGERNRWMTLRHASPRIWESDVALPDGTTVISRASPIEQLADAYATCRLGMKPESTRHRDGSSTGSWETSTTYAPRTNREQRRNCQFITRAVLTPVTAAPAPAR